MFNEIKNNTPTSLTLGCVYEVKFWRSFIFSATTCTEGPWGFKDEGGLYDSGAEYGPDEGKVNGHRTNIQVTTDRKGKYGTTKMSKFAGVLFFPLT